MNWDFHAKDNSYRAFIDGDEMKRLTSEPVDLYKWLCTHKSCQRYTKVWTFHNEDVTSLKWPVKFYAWMLLREMQWINPSNMFYMCGIHYKIFKRNPSLISHKLPSESVVLIKKNLRKKPFSIIQKINE